MSSDRRKPYPFDQIEPKWQAIWEEHQLFHAPNPGEKGFDPAKPKFYVLDMFPYPSGAGLHVGHPEGYTATDIVARYKRMRGFNVLHPMGWDAFGLPAEQYAIKTGQHPAITTRDNVAKFKSQLKRIGFSYDWQREINTTEPTYYKWTQWIFLQIYNSWFNPATNRAEPISTYHGSDPDNVRLAYVADVPVNWCPELGTVLANEEVVDGKSEVGGFPVVRRPMRQWMLRITAYAERLLNELDGLNWPEGIKLLQRNWIGRSEGAEINFEIDKSDQKIRVFTTRPDTLYGATYMVLAPEHSLVEQIVSALAVRAISNALSFPKKKRAYSPVRSRSIRLIRKRFRSGSQITFCLATARARSRLCQRTTSAISNLRGSLTCRFGKLSNHRATKIHSDSWATASRSIRRSSMGFNHAAQFEKSRSGSKSVASGSARSITNYATGCSRGNVIGASRSRLSGKTEIIVR